MKLINTALFLFLFGALTIEGKAADDQPKKVTVQEKGMGGIYLMSRSENGEPIWYKILLGQPPVSFQAQANAPIIMYDLGLYEGHNKDPRHFPPPLPIKGTEGLKATKDLKITCSGVSILNKKCTVE